MDDNSTNTKIDRRSFIAGADGGHAIEIEVWTGGETDVFVTIYRPISDIKELWPGSTGTEDDS